MYIAPQAAIPAVSIASHATSIPASRPLTRPVPAHFVASPNMTAFHAICPHDIVVRGCEHRLHVTSVEAIGNMFKEVHFVRH